MIAGFSESELHKIVSTVSAEQEAKIKAGTSPYSLDTTRMVQEAAGPDGAVYMKLLSGTLRTLPKLAPMFTDLTPEEFKELDADEAMIVAFGIFQRNYAFFTQRLLPVIAAFIAQQRRRTK
jgi:Na+-transporting methylmalonyl-CoA/oxaloacetate decarboxylase gamma subunit